MMRKTMQVMNLTGLAIAVGAGILLLAPKAQARTSVNLGVTISGGFVQPPVVVAPPAPVMAPPPVVVQEPIPQPVVVAPTPVYTPAPVYTPPVVMYPPTPVVVAPRPVYVPPMRHNWDRGQDRFEHGRPAMHPQGRWDRR